MKKIKTVSFIVLFFISNSTFSASKEKWVWEPFVSNETGTYYYHKEHSPKTEDGLFFRLELHGEMEALEKTLLKI